MKLVDAEKLLDDGIKVRGGIFEDGLLYIPMADVRKSIKNAQAIDAVPVVRCGECRYWDCGVCKLHSEEPSQYSTGLYVEMMSSDFCSYGELKEGFE